MSAPIMISLKGFSMDNDSYLVLCLLNLGIGLFFCIFIHIQEQSQEVSNL